VDVAIGDNDYDPAVVSVKPGDTVRWTNHGGAAHTVTADGGDFDSGTLAPGAVFTHKFPVLGSFPYHCTIHGPAMAGSVVVSSK
jgi:plastocyanin